MSAQETKISRTTHSDRGEYRIVVGLLAIKVASQDPAGTSINHRSTEAVRNVLRVDRGDVDQFDLVHLRAL